MIRYSLKERKKQTNTKTKNQRHKELIKPTEIPAVSLWREVWMDMKLTTSAPLTMVTHVVVKMWNFHQNKADGKILMTFGTAMQKHAMTSILRVCEYELELLN